MPKINFGLPLNGKNQLRQMGPRAQKHILIKTRQESNTQVVLRDLDSLNTFSVRKAKLRVLKALQHTASICKRKFKSEQKIMTNLFLDVTHSIPEPLKV